ncbi:vacuolar iron transporter homolog 4-like [Vigna unguiculata]|uniref:Vacuolar iron transporter n=1 Tax=Vigna unguiculata TaxID=3917 RepID=A0A4D6LRP8_VIGUN|nr:vacuolar iron transporter homolog 4-like [Vigna unguiculata]QCD91171.1 Ccc1 family [Vigna unguiculata]
MASLDGEKSNENHVEIRVGAIGVERKRKQEIEAKNIDYSERANWVRAAVLGANDGLVSVASLMMGVGAVKENVTAMVLAGFAGLIAGACSMAIGEFVSVYTQYDIEMGEIERERENKVVVVGDDDDDDGVSEEGKREKLPNPFHAAVASALAFSVGAVVPLLSAAFIRNHKIRLGVVVAVASITLVVFGWLGAVLGKTPITKSCLRVLIGGWMAMTLTFGLTKLFAFAEI